MVISCLWALLAVAVIVFAWWAAGRAGCYYGQPDACPDAAADCPCMRSTRDGAP